MDILEGKAPYGISTTDRITRAILKHHKPVVCKPNPIKTALKYKNLYEHYGSVTSVANQLGVSRVWAHQMLNLFKLDQRIIDYVLNITNAQENNFWTERKLRAIARLPKEKQYAQFLLGIINLK